MPVITALISGYPETTEWLLLIAAVIFGVAGVLLSTGRRVVEPAAGGRRSIADFDLALVAFGLMVVAIAWLVL